MLTHKLSDHISYIGVNDRTTQRFEGLWPLPQGVSYNSYLVIGSEKTAIIDGVDADAAMRQIQAIKELLGGRQPDYMIINHMEPDHSGSIALLRQAFPGITLVGNAQTHTMIKGYYGDFDNVLAVKNGDTLSLGDVTLQFHLTPMLHWPETMMTYLVEEKTLFSGDAFGCFGALNGAVVDTDCNTDRYFPEMVRYYSNIVGKYGRFVQRALSSLSSLAVDTICSTHGPVWRQRAKEVVSLYDTLSAGRPLKPKAVTIVYGSMYGNSERIAECVAAALVDNGIRDIAMFNSSYAELSEMIAAAYTNGGLVIVAPTYNDGIFPAVNSFVHAIAGRGLSGRHTLLFGNHTWAPQAVKKMTEALAGCDLVVPADPIMLKYTLHDADIPSITAAATTLAKSL